MMAALLHALDIVVFDVSFFLFFFLFSLACPPAPRPSTCTYSPADDFHRRLSAEFAGDADDADVGSETKMAAFGCCLHKPEQAER